jgi:excisionase family DNA binding protein
MVIQTPQLKRRDAAEASLTQLLDTPETCAILNIGKRTLQERVAAREIGCIKIGRSIRFHMDDIHAFIERNRVKPIGWKGQAK